MALDNPINAWLQLAKAKNQNRRQAMADAQGIGENIGQGFNTIGQAIQEQKKKSDWQKTINGLMNDPSTNPQLKQMLPLIAQHPELMGQLGPGLVKQQAPRPEYQAVPGIMSKGGKPFIFDKFTGEMKEGPMEAKPSGGFGSAMAEVRQKQNLYSDLPSVKAGNASAASMVQMSARQGKALVATPGSAQKIALGGIDLARTVQRSAPQLDAINGAGFADNLATKLSKLQQRLTADPKGPDAPKIRKEMYDLFDDLDRTASVYVKQGLDTLQTVQQGLPKNVIQNELGTNLPNIPFQGDVSGSTGGWSIQKAQ